MSIFSNTLRILSLTSPVGINTCTLTGALLPRPQVSAFCFTNLSFDKSYATHAWRDIPNGVSRQFYSPASSGIRSLTCERCELYGRIEYH